MARKRGKFNNRSETGSFIQLHKSVINRSEFYSLSTRAFKLLIDLQSQYTGYNNGDFCMAWSVMSKRGWKSRQTLNDAKNDLLDAGFIIRSRVGGMNKATLYAITYLSIDECKGKLDIDSTKVPPHCWKK